MQPQFAVEYGLNDSEAERIVKIFELGAELQLSIYHDSSAVKTIKIDRSVPAKICFRQKRDLKNTLHSRSILTNTIYRMMPYWYDQI